MSKNTFERIIIAVVLIGFGIIAPLIFLLKIVISLIGALILGSLISTKKERKEEE